MKFKLNESLIIDTSEAPWRTEGLRVGLFGGSGSGKSSTAALLAEQFLSQGGSVVIFEPRAEYHVLKEKFDVVVCGGPYGKDVDFIPASPSTYAKAVVEEGVSLIFYTSDVEDETKLIEFVSRFIHYMLKYNEVVKRPIMLIAEETHEYAPMSTKGRVSPPWVFSRMIKAFKTASIDARKLNIVPVVLSPRPQEVAFTIRQLCNLTFYGKFSAQDIHYIDSQCLKYYKSSFYQGKDLLTLETGQFAVITSGKTLPLQKITEPRLTRHGAETPKLEVTVPHKEETKKAVDSLTKTITEALAKEQVEQSELEKTKRENKRLETELADAWQKIEKVQQQADTLGKIRIESPQTSHIQPQPNSIDLAKVSQFLKSLKNELDEAYENEVAHFLGIQPQSKNPANLWETWKDKMPNTITAKIFKFLIDHAGAKFSRTEVATQLAYSSRTSGVQTALSWLRRNNLIQRSGDYWHV